ncbi:hypothetical protein [Candidatus Borrarchaeum sp.]|uniref:hypothetical protein n=1 Tax=Candidatus Borrarchaeum sp. TaxID=2846742 RepID=UPI00257D39FB|nr:hypothetical protein [Candidatus Borrarchaeum sp.]
MSPRYVCPICLMEEDRHHKLIENENERENNLLAVKRIPILVKRDESTQVRFILTTIHEHCYESYMSPLSQSGLKNGVVRIKKIVDVFK